MRRNVYTVSSLAALVAFAWACDDAPVRPNARDAADHVGPSLRSYSSAGTPVTAPPVPEAILRALEDDAVPHDPALIDEVGDPFGVAGLIPGLANQRAASLDAFAAPPPTCTDCQQYQGTLVGPGDSDLQPGGTFYFHSAGTHHAWLDGPAAANFDVYLLQYSFVDKKWKFRAYAIGATSDEEVVHVGSAGYYVWLVYARSGGGPYDFWIQTTGEPFDAVTPETLVGAGDIADCTVLEDAEATAALLDQIPGTVFTAGDNAYEAGTMQQFMDCYDPTWGRHIDRTRPTPGNHEYYSLAIPYFAYFGSRAGTAGEGWYSYELGSWHIIALNSNLPIDFGTPQIEWLQADLAAHPNTCTLAYWHHPRFSSGVHGNADILEDLWTVLYNAGVDVVISGHDHIYERFAPQRPDEVADPANGIREFTAGTGGGPLGAVFVVRANSQVRSSLVYHGVLKLTLYESIYDWEFVPEFGQPVLDAGSYACH